MDHEEKDTQNTVDNAAKCKDRLENEKYAIISLTRKEKELLILVLRGGATKEYVAAKMNIKTVTVDRILSEIVSKFKESEAIFDYAVKKDTFSAISDMVTICNIMWRHGYLTQDNT